MAQPVDDLAVDDEVLVGADRVHRGDEPRRVRLRVLPAWRRLRDERRGVDERVHEPARAPVVAGGAPVVALRGDGERQQHVGVRACVEAGEEALAVSQ